MLQALGRSWVKGAIARDTSRATLVACAVIAWCGDPSAASAAPSVADGVPFNALISSTGSVLGAPAQQFARSRHRAIWIGDSLAARGWGNGGQAIQTANSGFVVAGGPQNPVATITTNAGGGLIAGNYLQIFNPGDSKFGAPLNGAVVRVASTPSSTRFTVPAVFGAAMANGDYSAGYAGVPWLVSEMFQTSDASWLQWLNAFMKGYFTIVANYAIGGTTSATGVALLPKITAGPSAEYAFIQYCTNDVKTGIAANVATCLANVKTIVKAVEGLGMVPILCTPPAIGDPGAAPSDPASVRTAQALEAVRQGEMQLAAVDPQMILLDTYSMTVTPSDPAGHFLPRYAPVDGVHPSSYGEVVMARQASTYLMQFLPVSDSLPVSAENDMSVSTDATNVVQNGTMAGVNGTVITSSSNAISGTAPTGWSIQGFGGTPSAPLRLEVAGNGSHGALAGNAFDVIVRTAARGQSFQIGTNGVGGSSFGQRMSASSWYRCGFELLANTDLDYMNVSGQVFLNFPEASGLSVSFMSGSAAAYENGMPLRMHDTLQFLSQPFFLPARPTTAYLFIKGGFSGSVSGGSFSLGRAACWAVDNPYQ
jgi:lysophospholipase L1-like esterase